MTTGVLRADALTLPIANESVDIVITSPPYFALRSYQDDGEHYGGQIGAEPTPDDFLAALWAVTAECWRVLKPSGSLFVNLGDKYAGSDGASGAPSPFNTSTRDARQKFRGGFGNVRAKSLVGLPWRYALGCIDRGWILRAEIIWNKPNGLPESVTDRVRRSHETWFHLTKHGRYYSAMDELREEHKLARYEPAPTQAGHPNRGGFATFNGKTLGMLGQNPLGKLPPSVWTIPTEPLRVPEILGVDHFAAFPSEWPRRLIMGWTPRQICQACAEGRRPVAHGYACSCTPFVDHERTTPPGVSGPTHAAAVAAGAYLPHSLGDRPHADGGREYLFDDWTPPPSRPAVVLDPFGGTGTTAMVAQALGRIGISVDLSADYCRLASWRINESDHDLKAIARTDGGPLAESLRDRRAKSRAGYVEMFPDDERVANA